MRRTAECRRTRRLALSIPQLPKKVLVVYLSIERVSANSATFFFYSWISRESYVGGRRSLTAENWKVDLQSYIVFMMTGPLGGKGSESSSKMIVTFWRWVSIERGSLAAEGTISHLNVPIFVLPLLLLLPTSPLLRRLGLALPTL